MTNAIKAFKKVVKENIQREGIDELMAWIEESGFYQEPASTKYHGAHEGGLLEHTLDVHNALLDELDVQLGEGWEKVYSNESVAIVALFHDLCKIGRYAITTKAVKTETGWVDEEIYIYADDKTEMGHAAQSIFYIQQHMQLTEVEAQAIYWHMGAYDISQFSSSHSLAKSYRMNPLSFLLHRADEVATFITVNENFIYPDEVEDAEEEAEEIEEEVKPKAKKTTKAADKKKAPKKKVEPEPEPEPEEEEEEEEVDEDDLLEEDFFYKNEETGEYGMVAKGEPLPEDYDDETWTPVFKEEFEGAQEEDEAEEEDDEAEEKAARDERLKKSNAKRKSKKAPAKKKVAEPEEEEEDEEEEEEAAVIVKPKKKPVAKSGSRKPKPKPRAKK